MNQIIISTHYFICRLGSKGGTEQREELVCAWWHERIMSCEHRVSIFAGIMMFARGGGEREVGYSQLLIMNTQRNTKIHRNFYSV